MNQIKTALQIINEHSEMLCRNNPDELKETIACMHEFAAQFANEWGADKDGWINCQMPQTPYTGNYEVKDSEGHIFECVYSDIDNCWYCDNLIVSYRHLPQPPTI